MIGFGRRRTRDDQVAAALRTSLLRHARQAPRGEFLAERILAAVDEPAPVHRAVPRRRFGSAWALPAIAAASVAAIAAIAVGIANVGTGSDQAAPPAHRFGPTHQPATKSVAATGPASTSNGVPAPSRRSAAGLQDVHVLDLTFADTDDGWALASARCLHAQGRCTAVLRTHDGRTWTAMGGENFNVPGVQGCRYPCVEHLRFATDGIGYAFGPKAFFMTTDGGKSWQRQPGGAIALETLDGNVIRIVSPHTGCPGPCDISTETAAVGSTVWTPSPLTASQDRVAGLSAVRVDLVRGGSDAYLLATRNPASGGGVQTSTLFRSVDDGATWQQRPEPCPQRGGENDSYAIAAGKGNDVTALCVPRQGSHRGFVTFSSDAGATFTPAATPIPGAFPELLAGDQHTVLLAGGNGLARSTDGGRTWTRVDEPFGTVTFVGFESETVGRVIAGNGATIWTTRDAGRTWHRATFR